MRSSQIFRSSRARISALAWHSLPSASADWQASPATESPFRDLQAGPDPSLSDRAYAGFPPESVSAFGAASGTKEQPTALVSWKGPGHRPLAGLRADPADITSLPFPRVLPMHPLSQVQASTGEVTAALAGLGRRAATEALDQPVHVVELDPAGGGQAIRSGVPSPFRRSASK